MDKINQPPHYTGHPSGVECIQITEHMNFCLGNAVKYLWRAGLKDGNPTVDDLRKAVWYIEKEIKRVSHADQTETPKNYTQLEGAGSCTYGDSLGKDPAI